MEPAFRSGSPPPIIIKNDFRKTQFKNKQHSGARVLWEAEKQMRGKTSQSEFMVCFIRHQQCWFTLQYHWQTHCCSDFIKTWDKRELVLVTQMCYTSTSLSPAIPQHEWAKNYFEDMPRGSTKMPINSSQRKTGPHQSLPRQNLCRLWCPPRALFCTQTCRYQAELLKQTECSHAQQVTKLFHSVTLHQGQELSSYSSPALE